MVSTLEPTSSRAIARLATLADNVLGGKRLVLASNRGPMEFDWNDAGQLEAKRGSGGVVTALTALSHHVELVWVSSAMTDGDRAVALASLEDRFLAKDGTNIRARFAVSSEREYDLFYNVFANPILWFVQHELHDMLRQKDFVSLVMHAWHDGYRPVNQTIAKAILAELARPDTAPVVMLHDYQLYLVAGYVRERRPDVLLQQFIHIPWPRPAAWQALPGVVVRALCRGLLANDIVGFQTKRDAANFIATCEAVLPEARCERRQGLVECAGRRTLVRTYPISVDVAELRRLAESPEVRRYEEQLKPLRGEQTIVRVDRLDPSKNVIAGYNAFAHLLESRPDLRGKVRFISCLVPTRTNIPEYRRYAARVFEAIDAINGTYGRPGWQPVEVLYENNYAQAIAAMRLYDVLMVNSSVDGMNLVSKEGPIVNQRDGVLVLSRGAGSHEELGRHALSVAPFDVVGTAAALERALTMDPAERRERARALRRTIEENDIVRWVEAQLADMGEVLASRGEEEPVVSARWRSA